MMDFRQLAQKTIDMFNDRSLLTESKNIADANIMVTDIPSGHEFRGPDGFVQFSEGFITAMPDIRSEVVEHTVNGNKVTTLVRVLGTFTGILKTTQGSVPGNGNMIDVKYTLEQEFNDAGKLTRFDVNYDLQDFMAQLSLS